MTPIKHAISAAMLLLSCTPCARAAALPKAVDSAPCRTAPTIDGVIGPEEWRDAKVISFDMRMIGLSPASLEQRACELRVMNSSNALYIALRIPDEHVNNRLSPLDLDMVMLAFCQGDEVKSGDDRKAIAEGIYLDKHVTTPGKDDADDAQIDGRGSLSHQKGTYTFEWAVPLNSDDVNDLRAKPGDAVRFNVAYFDAFKPALQGTRLGGAFGPELKSAKDWGVIRLAANVVDDGGTAFRGPAWVAALLKRPQTGQTPRLRSVESTLVTVNGKPAAKASFAFDHRDPSGAAKEAKGKLLLPPEVQADSKVKVPLFFVAGYELDDGSAMNYVKRGWAVVSPRALETNPLIRTCNPDIALLHIARALPFVDDTRVIIGGGSAGGYVTLMLAAETFPLAGAAPDVPPVNWGYNGAYFFKQVDTIVAPEPGETVSKVPAMYGVGTMLKACKTVYGNDYDDSTWYSHSPLAHLPTITCPVSVYWSTADMLVPIDQIGKRWVQPIDRSLFPERFALDPASLTQSREGRLRLLDVLPERDYEVFVLQVPPGTSRHNVPGGPGKPVVREMPVSADKPWSIVIVDEGPPIPSVDHRKYDLLFTRDDFFKRINTGKVPVSQLTAAKLERLVDRFAGKEWLRSPLQHLDDGEAERADVLRGLRTYASSSPENAKHLDELYAKLPREKRVLEAEALKVLQTLQSR